jgi:hypothetical protein
MNIVIYDKAKWHADGDYPGDLDPDHAFHHTGMYFGWLVERNLLAPEFLDDIVEDVEAFKTKVITAPMLFRRLDGVLSSDMLGAAGNGFTSAYFDFERGRYLTDYDQVLASGLPSQYHVADTWQNYETLKQVLDQRFHEWQNA